MLYTQAKSSSAGLGPWSWAMLDGGSINVRNFGAKGDGITDDTAAIQAALNELSEGGTLYFPPGIYIRSARLNIIHHGTRIQGHGWKSVIKDAPSSSSLPVALGAVQVDGISVRDLAFLGNGVNAPVIGSAEPAIAFTQCDDAVFSDLFLSSYRGSGISLASCERPRVQHSKFRDMGQASSPSAPTMAAMPCINAFKGGSGSTTGGSGARFLYNDIDGATCVGISLYSSDGQVIGNSLKNIGESAIISNYQDPATPARRNVIANNDIDTVTMAIFTATGMEIIGDNYEVSSNLVRNCGADGISMRGTYLTCIGNQSLNNGRQIAHSSGIVVMNDGADPLSDQGHDIILNGNMCSDDQFEKTQAFGIRFVSANSGGGFSNWVEDGNICHGNTEADRVLPG